MRGSTVLASADWSFFFGGGSDFWVWDVRLRALWLDMLDLSASET